MAAQSSVARELARIGRRFYARGWALGTSGNFSAVVSRAPFRLAITASAVNKGGMQPRHILHTDERGKPVGRKAARPSAETMLHLEIVRCRGAAAVLHTHSVWGTMLSELHAAAGGMTLEGYEMLKGLTGVRTHDHREWIPILENDQDMARLSRRVADTLRTHDGARAFLLRRHGLYTWGATLGEAERHVEVLEFLLETAGRLSQLKT
jgi:methylthioribulose-1-phosphate dehydratase